MNIKQVLELVEKWIADPKSVSRKELKVARAAADVYAAAYAGYAWYAVHAALDGDTYAAKYWVAEYHKITKE
tara:strand:- start:38 stop:253 length:216 start_codon:yes stop_codon:yes gene_type:complete